MDLIYMNAAAEDVGVLQDYSIDLAIGSDENDFDCTVNSENNCCKAGYFLYYEGSELGGIIDSIEVDTDAKEITYHGRTWHGIMASKIICPDSGQDYLTLSGEANSVIGTLITRLGLSDMFSASSASSGITIKSYKMNRYIDGYKGICKMLKDAGAKLNVSFSDGHVVLSAEAIVDYSKDEQFDQDQIGFVITKNYKPVNHVICLGKGDLSSREVIHLYTDSSGQISHTQSLTGIDEVTKVYDYSSAESSEELEQGGVDLITESWNSDEVKFDFDSDSEAYDIGDIVGAKEHLTGIAVAAEITKKIVKISKGTINISYKVGD